MAHSVVVYTNLTFIPSVRTFEFMRAGPVFRITLLKMSRYYLKCVKIYTHKIFIAFFCVSVRHLFTALFYIVPNRCCYAVHAIAC